MVFFLFLKEAMGIRIDNHGFGFDVLGGYFISVGFNDLGVKHWEATTDEVLISLHVIRITTFVEEPDFIFELLIFNCGFIRDCVG